MVLPLLAALAPFAPLIGAGVSAVGSLLAKPESNKVDLVALRAEAERAGFNPLAVLRSGAAAGFGVSSGGNNFSNALQTFGSGIAQWSYDPLASKRAQVELDIAEATLKNLSTPSKNRNLSGASIEKTTGTRTDLQIGAKLTANPWFSDAGDVTQRWGEPAEWLYSPVVIGADLVSNGWNWASSQVKSISNTVVDTQPMWPKGDSDILKITVGPRRASDPLPR